jgi:hypothetical protein
MPGSNEAPKQEFTSKEQEYMYWQTRLGHLSKTRMRQLAKRVAFQSNYQPLIHLDVLPAFMEKQSKSHGELSLSPARLQRKLHTRDNVSQWIRWTLAQQASFDN